MKIIIISNVSRGLYLFRRELIEKLSQNNQVTILAKETGFVDEFKKMGANFINVDMNLHGTNPAEELKLYANYKRLLKELKPEVVLTYTIKPNIYGGMASSRLGIKYIVNITGLGSTVEGNGFSNKLMLKLYGYGIRKAHQVFFQNNANLKFMKDNGALKSPYQLIPGSGVNLERYKALDYPNGETVDFTYIGRVTKQKGIEQYLEAAKAIKNKYPFTRFHLCGKCDPEYENRIKELHDKGEIIYHGMINDISGMHAISWCTVHPSFYPEGMSNVLLESCACARPVITTNRPGCREIVDEGKNGYLVKEKDAQDLIEKIETFLKLPWEEKRKMGLEGRRKVENEFDRNIVINEYMKAIFDYN